MPEIDLVTEDVDVQQLPYILLALVGIQAFLVSEALSDLSDLKFDTLGLRVFVFAGTDVRDELVESTHLRRRHWNLNNLYTPTSWIFKTIALIYD